MRGLCSGPQNLGLFQHGARGVKPLARNELDWSLRASVLRWGGDGAVRVDAGERGVAQGCAAHEVEPEVADEGAAGLVDDHVAENTLGDAGQVGVFAQFAGVLAHQDAVVAHGDDEGVALAWFAIGCPVCNKLVLLALGTSGAMAWFAPLQPLLAVVGMVLLAQARRSRLRAANSCPAPARAD